MLKDDENPTFKESLATSVMSVIPLIPKSHIDREACPLVIDFLSEKQPPEVRAATIANLKAMNDCIPLNKIYN